MTRDNMTWRRLAAAVAGLGLAVALTACGTPEPAESTSSSSPAPAPQGFAEPVTFTDDLGHAVTVNSIERVVACMGSFANMWELAGGSLVGVSSDAYDEYEITSANVTTVGDFSNPNLEQILALEPDFVIMTGAEGGRGATGAAVQPDMKPSLDDAGIPVAYFKVTTFEDYLRVLETMTNITGQADRYEQYGTQVRDQIDEIIAQAPADETPPLAALMITFSGGTRVQAATSQTGAMLADLGVTNLVDDRPSLLQDFNLENLIEINPDFIFVVPMGLDQAAADKALQEQTADHPGWATMTAVQEGRYHILEPRLFTYKPNADWAEAYQTLFDLLYGQG